MCSKGCKVGDSMNVSDIPLREKPSHGSVKRVSRITEDWLLIKLGISGFRKFIAEKKKRKADEQEDKHDSILKLLFEDTPDMMSEFMGLQDSEGEYQTIMLATGWNLQKMLDFEDEASEGDYQTLLKRCIKTLGGTAADFFGSSRTGSSSQEKEGTMPEEETPKA